MDEDPTRARGQEPAVTDQRLARRLKALRQGRHWSLDQLAQRSGVSRATLSRLENGEVSPTVAVLGKLCPVYGLTLSRLMLLTESDFAPLVAHGDQPVWQDPTAGFTRRFVSPPADPLVGEVLDCTIGPGRLLRYDEPPRPGLEHHLVLIQGQLAVTVDSQTHRLVPGDCLRYRLLGPSSFATPDDSSARYFLFTV